MSRTDPDIDPNQEAAELLEQGERTDEQHANAIAERKRTFDDATLLNGVDMINADTGVSDGFGVILNFFKSLFLHFSAGVEGIMPISDNNGATLALDRYHREEYMTPKKGEPVYYADMSKASVPKSWEDTAMGQAQQEFQEQYRGAAHPINRDTELAAAPTSTLENGRG